MKKIFTIAASLFALVSCTSLIEEFEPVFTLDYGTPGTYKVKEFDPDDIITIADLVKKYKVHGTPWEMEGGLVIAGRVSTTDQPGNFYKSFYIQDETGGIEIKMGKNGLYNDYIPGQTVYISCDGLTLGEYGYSSNANYGGNGMVNIGFNSPKTSVGTWYETSYLESMLLIDYHVYRGDPADIKPVEPIVVKESDLPRKTDTQATNHNLGKLVTLKGLKYADENFCLLYVDSNRDKKSYDNRVFLSDSNPGDDKVHGITTWAMSKSKMEEYLYVGLWDDCKVGSGSSFAKDAEGGDLTVGDFRVEDGNGNVSYPGFDKAAYAISQYFKMGKTEIQVRTSGYSKFGDYEIPEDVLSGERAIDVTGVICLYQGSLQLTVNSAADFVYSDTGKQLYE